MRRTECHLRGRKTSCGQAVSLVKAPHGSKDDVGGPECKKMWHGRVGGIMGVCILEDSGKRGLTIL